MQTAVFRVPVTLRAITDNCNELAVPAGTVREVMAHVGQQFPELEEKLVTDGDISPYMNLYLNGKDVRFLERLDTRVAVDDVLTVLPTVAGG